MATLWLLTVAYPRPHEEQHWHGQGPRSRRSLFGSLLIEGDALAARRSAATDYRFDRAENSQPMKLNGVGQRVTRGLGGYTIRARPRSLGSLDRSTEGMIARQKEGVKTRRVLDELSNGYPPKLVARAGRTRRNTAPDERLRTVNSSRPRSPRAAMR
jgi:hypothetical protein